MPRVKIPARRDPPVSQEPNFIEEEIQEAQGSKKRKRYDRTRFQNALKAVRYENFFKNQAVVCERDVVISDFAELGLLEDMERRGWVGYLRNGGRAIIDLVQEFYSNAEIFNNAIRTYVRGIRINVDEASIKEIRPGLPQVDRPQYPPRKDVELNRVGKELTGDANFAWERRTLLKQGELTDKYKMLNLIAVANLAPLKRKNEILPEMARLLYAIGRGHSIDLASLILNEIKKGCNVRKCALPFGTLVTEICLENGVWERPEMEIQLPMGLLDRGSFKRSRGHGSTPAARHEEPPARGADEIQEELDREEEMEIDEELETGAPGPSTSTRISLRQMMMDIRADQAKILRQQEEILSYFRGGAGGTGGERGV